MTGKTLEAKRKPDRRELQSAAAQLFLLGSSLGLVALVAYAVAGGANVILLGMFTSAAVGTGILHGLFPCRPHFSSSFAVLTSVYASIFAFFVDEVFGHIRAEVLGIGFAIPLVFFVGGCWLRRNDVRSFVDDTDMRGEQGVFSSLVWLIPVLGVGAIVFALSSIAETIINTDWAYLVAMFMIGLIVLAVSRNVAMFLVEAGLLFDEFFARMSRLVIPAFAFLTFYSLLVVVFASLYSIISQHSLHSHFRVGAVLRALTFPEAIHFSLTTLSTVGYGDIVPISNAARVIASVQVVCGVLLLLFGVSELLEYMREHRRDRPPRS